MKRQFTWDWLMAALIRAGKTVAQTALGLFTVGAALDEVNWAQVLSVSIVAGIYSILTSAASGLPEVAKDGEFLIDLTGSKKDIYRLDLQIPTEELLTKKTINLSVRPRSDLSQE